MVGLPHILTVIVIIVYNLGLVLNFPGYLSISSYVQGAPHWISPITFMFIYGILMQRKVKSCLFS